MFDVFEYAYMHLPCVSEGTCAIIAAEQSYTKSVKKKGGSYSECGVKCFQDHLSHMSTIVKINTATLFLWQHELLCAGMYGSSDESPRTPPRLDGHPRHICVWGYTAQLQKEILTLKSLFKWSHSMRRALHRLRKSRNTVKRERVVRTDCL